MFHNGAKCDIYIGHGAGKKLLKDIREAEESVKVVSPYLSPFLIKELIDLHHRSIKVELITTDDIEDFYGNREKNIYDLIIQNRKTDNAAVAKREKWEKASKILSLINLIFLLLLVVVGFFLKDWAVAWGAALVIILYMIIHLYKSKIKNKRIYSYSYSQLFPFKVCLSPFNKTGKAFNAAFIHSKIYLIDDKIAYLGSLNFTKSGTTTSYESRVRTEDPEAVAKIKAEIYQLMNRSDLPEKDIQLWGKKLYEEPIN